jgi:hypothetical protein
MDDSEFEGMRRVLNKKMKDLAASGVGIEKRQPETISLMDEQSMWENGILGSDTPDKLRDTLLYSIGLNFALRAGAEHYSLRVGENSQLKVGVDKVCGRRYLEYTEDVSKCNSGGIFHRKLKRKQTRAYENVMNLERCVVTLFEKYESLRCVIICNALYIRSTCLLFGSDVIGLLYVGQRMEK